MKWLDVPPNWLLLFAVLAYVQSLALPLPGPPGTTLVGYAIVAAGLALAIWAFREMTAARTTPIPHREPSALVTTGPFARSRNPIYLADLVILLGLVVLWRAWPSLLLVPGLAWVLERRFIAAEETRCARAFGPVWEAYAARVRRWA